MIIADYHCHTNFSTDSDSTPEEMVEGAISLGLQRICFTDHMDYLYPGKDRTDFVFDPSTYFNTMRAIQEKYKDRIEVLIGVELGLRNEPDLKESVRNYYISLQNDYNFDFAIGSTHVLEKLDPYYNEYWTTRSCKKGLQDYFQSIIDNCNYYDEFEVYGHLDYLVRYIPAEVKDYAYKEYQEMIDEILKTILNHGKGIECNTSGLKYGLRFTHPRVEILKRYKELGGEILTIGSDGHKPEHLAYDFGQARELLLSLGYRYYTVYKNRKPEYLPL